MGCGTQIIAMFIFFTDIVIVSIDIRGGEGRVFLTGWSGWGKEGGSEWA